MKYAQERAIINNRFEQSIEESTLSLQLQPTIVLKEVHGQLFPVKVYPSIAPAPIIKRVRPSETASVGSNIAPEDGVMELVGLADVALMVGLKGGQIQEFLPGVLAAEEEW